MNECKVVFKDNTIIVGNWLIFRRNDLVVATENGKDEDYFDCIEQAIQYCKDNGELK